MIQPPSKRGGRVSGRGSSREHSQTNRKFPTKAPRKNKLRDALFFIFCLKNSRIFPTIEEKKSLYGRKVSKMDFGISSAGSYGTNVSPYDWSSMSANGTKNAQGTDDNPLSNNATNPLQPEDDTSKNSATNDVRLKDDKDLTPEERRAKASGHKSTPEECETCKRRKYQDGSDEMVSFKAAGHIDPGNAAAVVMSHEQEHVSNAYQKAKDNNGEVVRASVRLKTAVCPECGRTYISGGETTTQIRYYNETNPYQQDMKESDADNKYRGANVDIPA